ncbi:MAG: hypothetical protein JG782_1069 [Anaerophaga sp.]|nr:hypothetical protein [Anaerophaga sp.]
MFGDNMKKVIIHLKMKMLLKLFWQHTFQPGVIL